MKKIILGIALITILMASSCNKPIEQTVQVSQITNAGVEFRSINEDISIDDIDGYLLIELVGRIGSCDHSELTFAGNFNDKKDDAGNLLIEGFDLNKIWDGVNIRYLRTVSSANFDINQVAESESVLCALQSEMPNKYASFSESFSFPSSLCAESSIGESEVLSKNTNLTLTWTPDEKTDVLYVSICTPGLPCIIKEFPDTGSATISSEEFSSFVSGERVLLYIGRGIGSIIEQSNGKKIGIIRVQWSNYPGLRVQ
jgi:hypothetical protein